jgi:signal peptidase I
VQLFRTSLETRYADPTGFQVVRKPEDLVMSERRIVYDNDHQSKSLTAAGKPPRWSPLPGADTGWAADNPKTPKAFTHTGDGFGWMRYQHLMPPHPLVKEQWVAADLGRVPLQASEWFPQPGWVSPASSVELAPRRITNFLGYNAGYQEGMQTHLPNSDHWVGDLMLECTATFAGDSTVVLELAKGEHRYRAEFAGGQVRLKRFHAVEWQVERKLVDGKDTRVVSSRLKPLPPPGQDEGVLNKGAAVRPTGISGGTHALRFANVDCRLRVWVDDKPIDFGTDADYPPPPPPDEQEKEDEEKKEGWTKANDLDQPACVGASGAVQVSGLKVWRDTYYVNNSGGKVDTYYVQPGHYLCMGDNSSQSSDGRMWGLVPERLMLGRAVFTFWPVERIGFIK